MFWNIQLTFLIFEDFNFVNFGKLCNVSSQQLKSMFGIGITFLSSELYPRSVQSVRTYWARIEPYSFNNTVVTLKLTFLLFVLHTELSLEGLTKLKLTIYFLRIVEHCNHQYWH